MVTKQGTFWTAAALAGCAAIAVPAMAMMPRLPSEQYEGSVGYVTGGIGETEAHAFERAMSRHPLAIELLEHAGKAEEFTADTMIRIVDRQGHTVLSAQAQGPFMLVDLPPGRYSIAATLRNVTLKKPDLFVGRNQLSRATFEFPANTD